MLFQACTQKIHLGWGGGRWRTKQKGNLTKECNGVIWEGLLEAEFRAKSCLSTAQFLFPGFLGMGEGEDLLGVRQIPKVPGTLQTGWWELRNGTKGPQRSYQ